MNIQQYQHAILDWYQQQGRKDLPWQQDINPYRVWVSEIMLQQTQVKTVIPYFERFMQSFPTITALASADQEAVLQHWSGLGYYARGRNLHKAAQLIQQQYHGIFPTQFDQIVALPGIGRSTAGAILSISMQQPHPILDGNVKRVLCRYFAIEGWPNQPSINQHLWQLATELTPAQQVHHYTQAMMDLGATVCTRTGPSCQQCPLQPSCLAQQRQMQQQLPTPRPKKQLPTKQRIFVLLENQQGHWLLEQRASQGIWGGLWSLPEFEDPTAYEQWLQQTLTDSDYSINERALIKHSFTHYHLLLAPKHVKVRSQHPSAPSRHTQQWLQPTHAIEIGLPAPIKQLLQEINDEQNGSMPKVR